MQQNALQLLSKQGSFAVKSIPTPTPGPSEVLIRVEATALNPVDWKIYVYGFHITKYPAVIGSDIAGTVVDVGENVTEFEIGDRVITQGVINDSEHSSFQQYALGYADFTARLPDDISFEQGATIPLALATAAEGLFNEESEEHSAGLYPPWEAGGPGRYDGEPFVVFGGTTSVGQYVIQLANLAGFWPIITTASPHNAQYLLDIGASHIVDRHLSASATCEEIHRITAGEPIKTIYDAVSNMATQNMGYDLLASGGCLVIVLEEVIDKRRKRSDRRVVTVNGSVIVPDENRDMGMSLYARLTSLLEDGDILPNRVEMLPHGLRGIVAGLEKLRKGVSNVKLVALPQETNELWR